jgi:NhaP-type Na+/H+ or K+/H+ antiporter
MTHGGLASAATLALATALTGFAFGLVYFAALKRTVALYGAGRGWLGPTALTLGRLAVAVVLLVLAARLGAVPLLAAFAGFLAARALALRAARRAG